jgi:alpha-glucosidase/alpha-D-xyloside xylohydrolase
MLPLSARTIGLAIVSLVTAESAKADVRISPAGDHGVRIVVVADDMTAPSNPALIEQNQIEPAIRFKAGQTATKATVGKLLMTVSANPLRVRIEDAKGRIVQDVEYSTEKGVVTFQLDDAPVLGLGEGAQQFDRRGGVYPVRNGQVEGLATLGGRIHVPYLIGTDGWAMFIAAPAGEFDLRGKRGIFTSQGGAEQGSSDVFIFALREPADAMRALVQLTGAPVMPPKWALGYMQSHRTLTNDADLVQEGRSFRDKRLPCDAFIYLGTGFCPAGWNTGHDSFTFNRSVFSRDPADVIKDLHAQNLHVVLHVVPRKLNAPLHGEIPPAAGEALDAQHIAKYWHRHRDAFALGVDGWWPDEGDWYTIPERLERHKMYYAGPLSERPNVRPWNLQRNGYAGIARFGGWVWSGDIASTWRTLAAQVQVGQNYSLSVSPFWGTDTGGFVPTRELTGELYARWFQFSAFCPSFRSHGRNWHLRLPWGWNTGEPGPIESNVAPPESELHNAEAEPICRDYLNLRYQLMPYTYSITREACDTGLPLMRALWLHYPDDADAVRRKDEYLWGRDLLVAPVTERGATEREVYLPPGDFYDWWTGEKVAGRHIVARKVDLKTMPIYVRAGAIIPFDPVRQFVDEPVNEPTTIRVYTGADGSFVLYDDDGTSLEYQHGAGTWTAFAWNDGRRELEIKLDPRTRTKPVPPRELKILLLPERREVKTTFSGERTVVNVPR